MKNSIKVLIVDDSPTVREHLTGIIESSSDMLVIGHAASGSEAVRRAQKLKPDVISMDVHMPIMNGLDATREIMQTVPTPIVIVSASFARSELNIAFNAIHAGALAVIEKPPAFNHPDYPEAAETFLSKLRIMSQVTVVRRYSSRPKPETATLQLPARNNIPSGGHVIAVLGIASSTGGPGALVDILSQIPGDFAIPIVIVQHISKNFEFGLEQWLNQISPLHVALARPNDRLEPGKVFIAPAGYHLSIVPGGRISLDSNPGSYLTVPAADVMLKSLAKIYAQHAMGIVLTGMGADGARGLLDIRNAGGLTLAQDEATSVVFGMPGEAIALGAAEHVVPIHDMAKVILKLVSQ